jgi:hypothetical protein
MLEPPAGLELHPEARSGFATLAVSPGDNRAVGVV